MLSEDINWIARTLKHHLQEDGQIRILEKEAQGFIANLNTCARRVKVLERWPIATDAPRDAAVHAGTGRNNGGRRTRCCGNTYAIRTPREVVMPPPQDEPTGECVH